jgi:hypothetical protein
MILVDRCRPCGAPWPGGVACHLISDESESELLEFAAGIGVSLRWYQARATVPHFDLGPRHRAKAVAGGAREVDRTGMVEGMHRWRSKNAG